jgi:hypothetical protein
MTADAVDVDLEVVEDRQDEGVLLFEQRQQQVIRVDLRVPPSGGELSRGLDGLLRLDRKAVSVHI